MSEQRWTSMGITGSWVFHDASNLCDNYRGFGTLWPLDESYHQECGAEILAFLQEHVPEMGDVGMLEKSYGVCRGVYKEGRLGNARSKSRMRRRSQGSSNGRTCDLRRVQ